MNVKTEQGSSLIVEVVPGQEVRREIHECIEEIETAYLRLAELLHRVYSERMWEKWGFDTFEAYIEADLPFKRRKVFYLISIWDWFAVKVGDQAVLDKVKTLGWSKLRELVGVVTPENVDEWVKKANEVSCRELAELCRKALDDRLAGDEAPLPSLDHEAVERKRTKTLAFTLYPDQLETVEQALEIASVMAGSEKKGYLLSVICLEFAAQNLAIKEGKAAVLQKMAQMLGAEVIVFDAFTKKMLAGEPLAKRLADSVIK